MKESAEERLNTYLDNLIRSGRLDSWNSFVEALNVPNELMAALISNRAELVKLVRPHALTADEHAVYLGLIAGLMDTNAALRKHAEHLAYLTDNWTSAFKALRSIGARIEAFANFKHSEKVGVEEDA
jgi:hypothetical protein